MKVTAGLQWRKIANAEDMSYPQGIGVSAPAAGTTVRGVLLQDASFGAQVGAGLIKIPVTRTPAVRGAFETAGIRLRSE